MAGRLKHTAAIADWPVPRYGVVNPCHMLGSSFICHTLGQAGTLGLTPLSGGLRPWLQQKRFAP